MFCCCTYSHKLNIEIFKCCTYMTTCEKLFESKVCLFNRIFIGHKAVEDETCMFFKSQSIQLFTCY